MMPDRFGGYTIEELANAIAMVESSGGKDIGPRYEPGFERRYGSRYAQMFPDYWPKMTQQYSPEQLYASYGKHQLMLPVAVELGYRGTPEGLADEAVNRQFFEKKFMRDWKGSGGDLEQALLRYNGGGNPNYPNRVMRHLRNE